MRTIKVNRGQNEEIFKSIADLLENEDANAEKTGTDRFYERLSLSGTQFIIDSRRSGPTRIVFSTPGESEDIAYELDSGSKRDDTAGFTEDGASWFANFREGCAEPMESPDSDWAERRDRIADAYHRKYYTIEYVIDQELDEAAARGCAKDLVSVIGEFIYNDAPAPQAGGPANAGAGAAPADKPKSLLELSLGAQTGTPDTYYSAKLKVNVSFGVGQPIPVIGRIYYRYEGKSDTKSYVYTMLTREQAAVVDSCLVGISENSASGLEPDPVNQGAISSTLKTRLETDLNSPDGSKMFSESFLFSEKSMEVLNEHARDGQVEGDGGIVTLSLECKSIELISVAKIMWPNLRYTALYAGKEAFAINYSMTGTTISCISCAGDCREGEDALVRGNCIVFPESTGLNGKYSVYSFSGDGTLDRTPEGIRKAFARFMADTRIEDGKRVSVYSLSNFAKHLSVTPTCQDVSVKGSACYRLRICDCQRLSARGGVCLCKRCYRPENVFLNAGDARTAADRYVATSSLFFDAAEGRMCAKQSEYVYECPVCGRTYKGSEAFFKVSRRVRSSGKFPGYVCPTCSKALGTGTPEEVKESHELFKKYKGILGLGARVEALRSVHGCAENERYIMFRVGSSIYKFDKLLVTDTGYIKAAEKSRLILDYQA
ncbi:MAG: hypothetical protein LUE27_02325 [Clostridia bacterium]|nr:hypothetical protein [Clostridia bacterium]